METLIGRDSELRALTELLATPATRLVTITGPGGIGKTRLAMHAAHELVQRDGRRLVVIELADLDPAEHVVPAVADALGVTGASGVDLTEAVAAAMAGAPMLLLLDNLEHLRDAGNAVDSLLEHSRELTILATSRVPLGLVHERVAELTPLSSRASQDGLDDGPAVALFVDVLHSSAGDVALSLRDLTTIADVCDELGGLPLAIELAAGRCSVMTPVELLDTIRSHGPVRALDGRARTTVAESRHRDLGTTIQWSLDLLDAAERHVLDATATFTCWSTREEIADVACASSELTTAAVTDALGSLLTHRLVEARSLVDLMCFRLHPAVRAALLAAPRTGVAQLMDVHDAQAVRFARRAAFVFDQRDELSWLDALDRRHDDLAAVLQRALVRDDPEAGSALVLGLAQLWHQRGRADRHMRVVDQLLSAASAGQISVVDRSGLLAWRANVLAEWGSPATELNALSADMADAVDLAVASEDGPAIMRAAFLSTRSAPLIGHQRLAREHARLGLRAATDAGAEHLVARFQVMSALLASAAGSIEEAVRLASAGLLAARRLDAQAVAASATLLLVQLPSGAGGILDFEPNIADALRSASLAGDRRTLAIASVVLARQSLVTGDHVAASTACGNAIRHAVAMGHANAARMSIVNLVMSAAAGDHLAAAATLHGGIGDHLDRLRGMFEVERYRAVIMSIEARIGSEPFRAAVENGRALQWPDLVGIALACADAWSAPPVPEPSTPEPAVPSRILLSKREYEVVRALASGMSNKQIAAALEISVKTAMHHTTNIYDKLGVRGRAAATAWAYRTGVVCD